MINFRHATIIGFAAALIAAPGMAADQELYSQIQFGPQRDITYDEMLNPPKNDDFMETCEEGGDWGKTFFQQNGNIFMWGCLKEIGFKYVTSALKSSVLQLHIDGQYHQFTNSVENDISGVDSSRIIDVYEEFGKSFHHLPGKFYEGKGPDRIDFATLYGKAHRGYNDFKDLINVEDVVARAEKINKEPVNHLDGILKLKSE